MAFFVALAVPAIVGTIQAIDDVSKQKTAAAKAAEEQKEQVRAQAAAAAQAAHLALDQQAEHQWKLLSQGEADAIKAMQSAESQLGKVYSSIAMQIAESMLPQTALVQSICSACQSGNLDKVPDLLQRLDGDHFASLGQKPIALVQSEDDLEKITAMLDAERKRRG